MSIYVLAGGVNKACKEHYSFASSVNRKILNIYGIEGGINRRIYSSEPVNKINISDVPLNGTIITFPSPFIFYYLSAAINAAGAINGGTTVSLDLYLRSGNKDYTLYIRKYSGYRNRYDPEDNDAGYVSFELKEKNNSTYLGGGSFSLNQYNMIYVQQFEENIECNVDVTWTMGHGPSSYPRKIPITLFPEPNRILLTGYSASTIGEEGKIVNLNIWGY